MPAWAGAGVALLTVVSGPVTPVMEPFSEIPSDTRFSLGHEASIQFLHYTACEEVTVQRGKVLVTESGFSVDGGRVTRRALPCRHETVPQESGGQLSLFIWESGSVLMRGTQDAQHPDYLTLPANSVFILLGKRANSFSTVQVVQAGKPRAEIPVKARKMEWPVNTLDEDTIYELRFLHKNREGSGPRMDVRIAPARIGEQQEAFVLIDMEKLSDVLLSE